jgi:hypothetical protein
MADGLFSGLYKSTIPINVRLLIDQFKGSTEPITEKDFSDEELMAIRQAVNNAQRLNAHAETKIKNDLLKTEDEYNKNPAYAYIPDPTSRYPNQQKLAPVPYKDWLSAQKKALLSFEKTRGKTSFSYRDYDIKSGQRAAPIMQNWLSAAYQSYADPAFRVASTLGSANYYNNSSETPYVSDTYGFIAHPEVYSDPSKMSVLDIVKYFKNTPGALFEVLASKFAPQRRPVKILLPEQPVEDVSYKDPFIDTIR